MTTDDHQASFAKQTKTFPPLLSSRKNLITSLFFLAWLGYSAYALGWAILKSADELACTHHIKEILK